jgi:hypothetical protein
MLNHQTFMPVTKEHPATANFPDEWRYVHFTFFNHTHFADRNSKKKYISSDPIQEIMEPQLS